MPVLERTAISRPKVPDLVPGYKLERVVGRGGMGEVHQAVQLSLGRTVAVKVLAAELAKDRTFVVRFEKEGAALAALSHPNIVSIVDKGKTEHTYYLVMEFVDGPSLREVMRSPQFDAHQALRIVLSVCRAIDYAHTRGVIHRDLKPENILFDEQAGGIPKVTDFGLAGFVEEGRPNPRYNVTETHISMGTLSYMAPEQRIDAKSADHRADIYALGVILYELLVGELPIGNFDPPSQKKAGLDRRVDAVVGRCLKTLPQDRYQKVAELIEDLEPLVPVSHTLHSHKSRAVRARLMAQRVVRTATRAAGLVVVLAAVAVLAAAAIRSGKRPPRASPGLDLAADFASRWPLNAVGRNFSDGDRRRVGLGSGSEVIPLVGFGRKPTVEGSGAVTFLESSGEGPAGRAVLDVDLDGGGLTFAADAQTQPRPRGILAFVRELFVGPRPSPRSALLLLGDRGRFVALSAAADEAPVLEWSLGSDRKGAMVAGRALKGPARLELVVDSRSGRLSAYAGAEGVRQLIGDPLDLGTEWKKAFGEMPDPSVGCLDGACRFERIAFSVEREPPPPAPPPPPPVEPPKNALAKPPPRAPAVAKKPTSSSRTSSVRKAAPTKKSSKKR